MHLRDGSTRASRPSSPRAVGLRVPADTLVTRRLAGLIVLAAALGLAWALAAWAAPAADRPLDPAAGAADRAAAAGATGGDRALREGQLVINEFMADNDHFYFDEFGDDDDWVELFNLGPTAVNLEGKFLTDNLSETQKWEFPDTTIPVGGFLIVWTDGEPEQGPLHTTFKLERSGEQLGLFDYLGVGNGAIDTLSFGVQGTNISYGRYPDGTGLFTYMETPTPAISNQPHLVNLAPFIVGTKHVPIGPTSQDTVTINARIADDAGISQAKVFYNAGNGYIELALHDDGQHHDEGAGDQLWGAQILPYPNGTVVQYYVWAQDDLGLISLDPPSAPLSTYAYLVRDESPPLFINEFMALNTTTIPDEFGEYEDWIELYNAGTFSVGLLGLYITDNFDNPDKFALPDISIPARGFVIIWCDEDGSQGPLHANFKLSSTNGEEIGLCRHTPQGYVFVDSVTFGPQTADISRGRFPDGGAEWRYFTSPTPGSSNYGAGVDDPSADRWRSLGLMARPNPFGARTTLCFELTHPGDLELEVVDAAGRVVYSLVRYGAQPGPHQLDWRGLGDDGGALPGGIYACRIQAGPASSSVKVLLIR